MKAVPKIVRQFGQRVAEKRHDKGISQEKLGSLAGVHPTYIGMIEHDNSFYKQTKPKKHFSMPTINKSEASLKIYFGTFPLITEKWLKLSTNYLSTSWQKRLKMPIHMHCWTT